MLLKLFLDIISETDIVDRYRCSEIAWLQFSALPPSRLNGGAGWYGGGGWPGGILKQWCSNFRKFEFEFANSNKLQVCKFQVCKLEVWEVPKLKFEVCKLEVWAPNSNLKFWKRPNSNLKFEHFQISWSLQITSVTFETFSNFKFGVWNLKIELKI